jgi:hypothetical protein
MTERSERTQCEDGDPMTSLRQIEANRRNAQLSTGPVTERGKKQSRKNALRHGLTAETVINALEDAEHYAAFELAVTSDYDAQSAVERELVLRLASLLWRLRRATAIESGLFNIQAKQLLQLREHRHARQSRQRTIDKMWSKAAETHKDWSEGRGEHSDTAAASSDGVENNDLTVAYLRLSHLRSCPLDRLSRYEASLWRQACQTLFSLQTTQRRQIWRRI